MKSFYHEILLDTKSHFEFIDISDEVRNVWKKSGVKNGLVTIFTQHTTSAIKINERCERLQIDMQGMLERLVPKKAYRHDEDTVDSRANAEGHLMALLMNASETIPVIDGKLMLGTWQSVFFVELDGPRNARSVVVNAVGA